MIVRYEDVLAYPAQELERILRFMSISIDEESLQRAVETASFENMRKLESGSDRTPDLLKKSEIASSPALMPGDPSDIESYKTRRGGHGGFTNYLDKEDVAFVNELMMDAKKIVAEPLNYNEFLEHDTIPGSRQLS